MTIAFGGRRREIAFLNWRTLRDIILAFLLAGSLMSVLMSVPGGLVLIAIFGWIAFFLIAMGDRGPNSEWALFNWRPLGVSIWWTLPAIVPMMALASSAHAAYPGVISQYGKDSGAAFNDAQKTAGGEFFVFLIGVLAIPFVEESFFRGRILGRFRQHMHVIPAVLLSSFLFSIIHFRFDILPVDMLVAVLFSGAALVTGSVWASFAMHAAVNGSLLEFPRIGRPAQFIVDGLSELQLIMLMIASLLVLVILGLAARRTRIHATQSHSEASIVEHHDLTAAR